MKISIWVTFGICVLALIVISGNWLGILPTYRIHAPKTLSYTDQYDHFTFSYPDDLDIQDISQSNEKIRIINVMPKNAINRFDPQFIEIISYDMPKETLSDAVVDFLPNATANDLYKIERDDLEAIEYFQVQGIGEESLYTFFRSSDKMSIVIFRMRRFDKTNPLVLIDNSRYLSSYKQIVSTFNFN